MTQERHSAVSASRSRLVRRALLSLVLIAGCSTLQGDADKEHGSLPPSVAGPSKYHFRESQFVFYSDFPLKQNQSIFQELSDLREQIRKELQLPESSTLVQVYLFEDEAKYLQYMRSRYFALPRRRAFFIRQPQVSGGPDALLVFTWWSSEIGRDLRHELTHGILHSVCKDVPLWLDEGLAEIYELPPESNGVNSDHVDTLRKLPFQPDLARLEKLTEVKQMLKPEYREAWAWTHYLLRSKPETKTVLLNYLQQLRTQAKPPPLLPKLEEIQASPSEGLIEHLKGLQLQKITRVSNTEQR